MQTRRPGESFIDPSPQHVTRCGLGADGMPLRVESVAESYDSTAMKTWLPPLSDHVIFRIFILVLSTASERARPR